MAVVDVLRVQKRVVGILNAAPGLATFPATVSGKQGRFPSTTEIQYSILEVDNALCRDVIITGHPYRNAFMTVTESLTNGAPIPAHLGGQGLVEISEDENTWTPALLAKSKDDITSVLAMPTNYGLNAAASVGWAFIEDGRGFTTSAFFRVHYPDFVPNNTTCQSDASLEDGVTAGAISLLYKDGSTSELFDKYHSYYQNVRAELRAGAEVFPVLDQTETQSA